jgi:transposase
MAVVRVIQGYRFALDPSPSQERMLRSHAGAARFAWNWGLSRCKERYAAEGSWYSAADLHKLWNVAKKADPALWWWPENSKCAYQESFRDLSATVSRTAQRWFLSFTVDSDGNVIAATGPKPLRSSLRRLRRASRAHSRKAKGGANRRKHAGRLARIHARVANVRADALHKATSELARRYQTVVCEDLNVTGMLANRKLARAGQAGIEHVSGRVSPPTAGATGHARRTRIPSFLARSKIESAWCPPLPSGQPGRDDARGRRAIPAVSRLVPVRCRVCAGKINRFREAAR